VARFESVDEYIKSFPVETRAKLEEIRRLILEVAPGAREKISYQIPTITLDGRYLIYFAAWKHHIALYPIPRFEPPLEARVEPYRAAKDALHLPHAKPVPQDLVRDVVAELVARRGAGDL
jgi:uncharacterized protein YdhG (YjbR/CyaY superfamily)